MRQNLGNWMHIDCQKAVQEEIQKRSLTLVSICLKQEIPNTVDCELCLLIDVLRLGK